MRYKANPNNPAARQRRLTASFQVSRDLQIAQALNRFEPNGIHLRLRRTRSRSTAVARSIPNVRAISATASPALSRSMASRAPWQPIETTLTGLNIGNFSLLILFGKHMKS
jgi:hypothetical protein